MLHVFVSLVKLRLSNSNNSHVEQEVKFIHISLRTTSFSKMPLRRKSLWWNIPNWTFHFMKILGWNRFSRVDDSSWDRINSLSVIWCNLVAKVNESMCISLSFRVYYSLPQKWYYRISHPFSSSLYILINSALHCKLTKAFRYFNTIFP